MVISYLSQDFTLDPALDVRGNVRAGAQAVLDLIADNIEASFTTRAQQLDRDAAKEFGHGAGVEARLRSSIAKHRTEAGEFRAGSYQFALTRLNDYIDL